MIDEDRTTVSGSDADAGDKGVVKGEFKKVRKRQVVFERFNIRCAIESEADLQRLAASMASDGQVHPCIVIPHPKAKSPEGEDLYEGVTGSRRRLSLADDAFLDVCVLPADTPESVLWHLNLTENLNRKDLNLVERTIGFASTFDAVACEIEGYRLLGSDRHQRLRAYRNRLLNRANSKRPSEDSALDEQVSEIFDELMATLPEEKRVKAKTFFPRHLRVLDLPEEILRDVAELAWQDVLRLATAFDGKDSEVRQKLIDDICEKSANGELSSSNIRALANQTGQKCRRKRGVTLRFKSSTLIDERCGLFQAKNGLFVVFRLSNDVAADQGAVAAAVAKAHAKIASASASTTSTVSGVRCDPTSGRPDDPTHGGPVDGDQKHHGRHEEQDIGGAGISGVCYADIDPRGEGCQADDNSGESDKGVNLRLPIHISSYAAKSILTETGGFLTGYTHTLNTAIGCVYGRGVCGLGCYAAQGPAHLFNSDGQEWGDYVKVKANAPELLRSELERAARRDPEHPEHVSKITIFMSSSTEPCVNPVLPITRECLQVIKKFPIKKIVVQTRSPQVLELKDEIEALGSRCAVSFTIETDSDHIWNLGPKGAPGISVRRRTFEAMRDWSTKKHLAVAPCLKLIDPVAFADWIAATADLATVDTFVSGDGSPDGSRTSRSAIPEFYEQQGWDWKEESQAKELLKLLQDRMGNRTAWSSDGFNRLASI